MGVNSVFRHCLLCFPVASGSGFRYCMRSTSWPRSDCLRLALRVVECGSLKCHLLVKRWHVWFLICGLKHIGL